jgi:hypothetical protein
MNQILNNGHKRKFVESERDLVNIIENKQEDIINKDFSVFMKNNDLNSDTPITIKFNEFIIKHFGIDCIKNTKGNEEVLQNFHLLTYDCCINACCVFVGENKNLITCPKCNFPRYYTCSRKSCRFKKYDEMCLSHPQLRRNKASISYRSIELLISELIQKKSFIEAINHLDESIPINDDKIHETSYLRNMKEMKENFQIFWQNYYPEENHGIPKARVVEVNLCISWFYDSFQIYHRKVSTFAPLIFTILNLPPNIRNSLGFGTFLLSFFTYGSGNEVEKFLFYDCFIAELLMFQDGVSIVVTDDSNNLTTLYRVQIRVTTHILDMPALCRFLNVEDVFSSKFGCIFCNQGPGYYDSLIKKTKYFGTGRYLGMRSYFNTFATRQQCCPFNWYIDKRIKTEKEVQSEKSLIEIFDNKNKSKKKQKNEKQSTNVNDKKSDKLSLVESVLFHTGSTWKDLNLLIKWEGFEVPSYESWHINETIRTVTVVKNYIKSKSELKPFYESYIDTESHVVEEINKKKCTRGFHYDQVYVEKLHLCYNPNCSNDTIDITTKREEVLKQFLLNDTKEGDAPLLFLNFDILDFEDEYFKLSDDIYSEWADYRPFVKFKFTTTEEFKVRCQKANYLNDSRKRKKEFTYKGSKGHCSMMALKNIKIESDFGYDPFHIFENGVKQIFGLWEGSNEHRQNLPGIKAYCKKSNCHRCIWDDEYIKPWEFSNRDKQRVENYLSCLIIPCGSGGRLNIVDGKIFKRRGHIKGTQLLTLMRSLCAVILFANRNMRPSYKSLFRVFSSIITRVTVLNPIADDFDVLFWRAVEFRTFWERMLPVCEMTMVIHAIPETIVYIKEQGNIYTCWACPGEKCHSTFKKFIHTTGSNRPEINALSIKILFF